MKPIKEIPLVLFTILSQAAVGLTLMEGFFIFFYPGEARLWSPAVPGLAFLCLLVGLACSLFHLGHPSGGIRSLANLSVSWLSREILAFGGYGAVLGLDMVLRYQGMKIPMVLLSSFIAGLAAVAVSARVYKNPGYPALDTFWPFVFFAGTAWVLGLFLLGMICPSLASVLRPFIAVALVFELMTHFLAPIFWLSGGRAQRCTAIAHYRSFFFWIRGGILVLMTGLFVFARSDLSVLILVLLTVQELIGRVLFFNYMVHAADHIGKSLE
ncbi:MAG: dimethyl sulfoxide reductase anchor subunit [Proteobacteria bacterium]|nr:hypothetical protein [Desulfobacula sp.]MBU3950874.1 dimethyl sulfoxide reductase anchor subunit [Pseudomonadota bacterium]MBU4130336.1 dimethyl sulfoxide reductase anchor subunit [Pseudomonadota bacterium]